MVSMTPNAERTASKDGNPHGDVVLGANRSLFCAGTSLLTQFRGTPPPVPQTPGCGNALRTKHLPLTASGSKTLTQSTCYAHDV
jgi:hypothetical protein